MGLSSSKNDSSVIRGHDVVIAGGRRPVYPGTWELPVIGTVSAPAAVLIRPDGHVAWVGEGTDAGLVDALTGWFGMPARRDH